MIPLDQLEAVSLRYQELESQLADPSLSRDPVQFRKLSKEHAELSQIVETFHSHQAIEREIEATYALLQEAESELESLARQELRELEKKREETEQTLRVLLLPKDPNDEKDVVLELRAGAGGQEAALFVMELFRMYQRYCERQGWKVAILSTNPTGIGGFKEIIAEIQGQQVYSRLKWEGGVHRVQRVPETEAQGRVHTSTVTVAVLPEADEVDVNINSNDLRIDVFRSGGAGGQGVNTTDSAVRITHLPTQLVVVCQDERSQIKNKDKAMKILRSRLLDLEQQRAHESESSARKSMVGTGDRSEKIRTYNFPQGRLTDHRIKLTLYQLPEIMNGDLDDVLSALNTHHQLEALHVSS